MKIHKFAKIFPEISQDYFLVLNYIFSLFCLLKNGMFCMYAYFYANVIFLDIAFFTLLIKLSTIFLWSIHIALYIRLICCLITVANIPWCAYTTFYFSTLPIIDNNIAWEACLSDTTLGQYSGTSVLMQLSISMWV